MANASAILDWMVAMPVLGAGIVLALPTFGGREAPRGVATLFSLTTLLLALLAARQMDWTQGGEQLVSRLLIPRGTDGLSMPLVILVAAIGAIACWTSYNVRRAPREGVGKPGSLWHLKAYFAILLLTLAAALAALIVLVGTWFLIFLMLAVAGTSILMLTWGGDRSDRAARRFFGLWFAAMAIFLVALQSMAGGQVELTALATAARGRHSAWSFWFMLAGTGLMVPWAPLHRWLVDALTEASTPVAILVAAVMQTLGGHAFMRIFVPLFAGAPAPHAALLGFLGAGTAIYAGLAILGARDLRQIAAYVSMAQMGFFVLGLSVPTQAGVMGAEILLVSHGVSLCFLILVCGIIRDRLGHCDLARLGGLGEHMPAFGGWAAVAFLTAAGMPGLCVFSGEVLVILGSFDHAGGSTRSLWPGVLGIAAIALLAGGIMWIYQRVFFGPARPEHSNVSPLSLTEKGSLALLGAAALILGIMPMIAAHGMGPAAEFWRRGLQ